MAQGITMKPDPRRRRFSAPMGLQNLMKRYKYPRRRTSEPVKQEPSSISTTEPFSKLSLALISHCRLETVEKLIQENPQSLSEADPDGLLPLHVACQNNLSLAIIQLLLEHHKDAIRAETMEGQLPLHLAMEATAPLDVVQCLVQAHSTGLCSPDAEGRLPVHVCVEEDASMDVVEYISRQCPEALQQADKFQSLPLHLAITNSAELELIRLWVDLYPQALQCKDGCGRLLLHLAVFYRLPLDVVELLMERYPEATSITDKEGKLPLHIAVGIGLDVEGVKLILKKTPTKLTLGALDDRGMSPIHCALALPRPKSVLELLKLFVDEVEDVLITPVGEKLSLPLHIAAERQCSPEILQYIIDNSRDALQLPDKDGCLPLHRAISGGHKPETVATLHEASPRTARHRNSDGQNAVQLMYQHDAPLESIFPIIQACPDLMQ